MLKEFDDLHILDSVIARNKMLGENFASISFSTERDAKKLMRLLIAREAYSAVHIDMDWTPEQGYKYELSVFWD